MFRFKTQKIKSLFLSLSHKHHRIQDAAAAAVLDCSQLLVRSHRSHPIAIIGTPPHLRARFR